jgi:hypothetical protein
LTRRPILAGECQFSTALIDTGARVTLIDCGALDVQYTGITIDLVSGHIAKALEAIVPELEMEVRR